MITAGLELSEGWGVEPPPVHVYRHPFSSENRLYISIPISNISAADPPVLLGQFQHWITDYVVGILIQF